MSDSRALLQGLRRGGALMVSSALGATAFAATAERPPLTDLVNVVEVVEPASQWNDPSSSIDEKMRRIGAAVTSVDREWLNASAYEALVASLRAAGTQAVESE